MNEERLGYEVPRCYESNEYTTDAIVHFSLVGRFTSGTSRLYAVENNIT